MKKHHNPNSQKRLRRRKTSNSSWSDLPQDLLNLVLERLSFANFQRAKYVCSSWYSASRQSVPKNKIPWLILFPKNNHENSCMLLNPEETEKVYKTQDLGVEFSKSVCKATYGNWLFMQDPLSKLYILNLFTREKIDLPSVESQLGMVSVERTVYGFRISGNRGSQSMCKDMFLDFPLFWIDEKTKDYIVLWELGIGGVVFAKKGDTSWKQIPEASFCFHMVYKDHKLYFLSIFGDFKIFDFSGEIAQETFQCGVKVESFHLGREPRIIVHSRSFVNTTLVVTLTGKVLEVEKMWKARSRTWSFRIHDIYSSRCFKKSKLIKSLGNESMLLDQGITVLVNEDTDGFIKNSIYFNGSREKDTNDIFIFNLETHKTELLHNFDRYSVQFSSVHWFLPSFTQT